jgi:hypothetical protein
MVDEGLIGSQRGIAEVLEHGEDLGLDLVVVLDVLELEVTLFNDGKLERRVQIVDELLDGVRDHLEVGRDIAPEDASLERLDVTADVGLGLEQVTLIHGRVRLDVAIGHDDLLFVRFDLYAVQRLQCPVRGLHAYHEQSLAKCAGPFAKDLVRVEGDDVTEREDEGVDVFHVEVVSRNGVGDGVLRQLLWSLNGVAVLEISAGPSRRDRDHYARCHQLGIELDRVVAEFCDGDSLEALAPLRQVRVALDPAARRRSVY